MKMKTNPKVAVLAMLLAGAFTFPALSDEKTEEVVSHPAVFSDVEEIDFDGPVTSQWFPWGFGLAKYPSYTGGIAGLIHGLRCVHISVGYSKPYHGEFEMPEGNNYNCAYSVVQLDFTKREIVAIFDLYRGSDEPRARYLGAISGSVTDFFAPLKKEAPTPTHKVTTLNEVLTRLSAINTKFSQKRHMTGDINIRSIGDLHWNPLNKAIPTVRDFGGFVRMPLDNGGSLAIMLTGGNQSYKLRASKWQEETFLSAQKLFEALPKTLDILRTGYDQLREASDDEKQAIFRQQIQENAGVIRKELKAVMELLRRGAKFGNATKAFHIVETMWFMNEISSLVSAVDAILLDEYGSAPGFTEILQQAK